MPRAPRWSGRLVAGLAVAALLTATSWAATSATGPSAVKAALSRMAPGAPVADIAKAPLPGFYQALVGGRMVYVSADGKWVMDGHLYNADKQVDVSGAAMQKVRRQVLAKVPGSDYITFAPKDPKYSVTVFTDVDCAYCRVMHQHMQQYNAAGIAVHYLAWPRTGVKAYPSGRPTASYLKAVSVWCSKTPQVALTEAMQGKAVAGATCTNPVKNEFDLGRRIGVDGTPTVIAPDGTVLGGYVPPMQLLLELQKLKASAHAG
ncbi:MAG TPA: DsbC family protein [Rhodanobacteraceae bacterium]